MKLKEKTKNRIIVLVLAIAFFSIRWVTSAMNRDISIREVNAQTSISQENKHHKISDIVKNYDEVSDICVAAIAVYSVAIIGYIYFDRRERNQR